MGDSPERGFSAQPVERVRDEHPESDAWRADALAGSRHSRIIEELRLPAEDHDPERAMALAGEVTRKSLRDLAPALVLLPAAERRRAQALAAYALTLFDFAAQSGLEGERLTQINRWEFDLERTLEGEAPGQPVFVCLARAHELRPWPHEALEGLLAAARRRAMVPRPATPEAAAEDALALGGYLAEALVGEPIDPAVACLAAGLLRARGLVDLGEGLRRHRPSLAKSELPGRWQELPDGRPRLAAAVERERAAVGELLNGSAELALPPPYRAAARYLRLASIKLLALAAKRHAPEELEPPVLGAWGRFVLVLRSRWGA